jgi:lipopolysaccharide transport system permease protein
LLARNENSTSITVIEPREAWHRLDLAELWQYRELLYFLTVRDIKIRYKQTLIGIAWALLQPVLTTLIFTVIFSTFARFDTGGIPYSLFALSGLVVWLYVNNATMMASTSFVNNSDLVTKVYFPRLIVPIAASLAGLFDLLFGSLILATLMVYFSIDPSPLLLLAPLFVLLAFVLAASIGTLFAALNVRFRDVKFALPFLVQVWMIASPIFYPMGIIPERWRLIFAINPLTGILEGFRCSLFGVQCDWPAIAVSTTTVAAIALFSLFVFKRMEDDFADVI